MDSTSIAIIIAFICYLALMIFIGLRSMTKTKGTDDYFLGGRGLTGPVAAMSAQASDMSGWMLMGLPGSVYALGTGQAWIAIGLGLGTIANWLIIAKPLRAYTIVANNSMTLPEFLGNRFHDNKKILLCISSIVICIFFLVYTASALASGGKLFNQVFGLDYHAALVIGALVILAYTLLGGFLAVCTTDFIQGLLMLVGVLVVPIIAWGMLNGSISENLVAHEVNKDHFLSLMYNGDKPYTFVEVLSNLAWGFGYCGMPHILIRFMAIKSEKEVKKSSRIAIAWVVVSLFMACFIGVVGKAFIEVDDSEKVFIKMIQKVFEGNIVFAFIGGIFLCGILAAIMSTADSQLLVCSSAASSDIYKGVINPKADDQFVLAIGRIITFIVAGIAIAIAWNPESSIMNLVSDAWAGLGSAFGPLVVMSLFWKRTNLPGAVAGLVSGAATVILWDYIKIGGETLAVSTGIYSLLIGFFVSLICIVVVSLITKAPSEEILNDFDAYKNYKDAE